MRNRRKRSRSSTRGVDVYWNSTVIGTVILPPDPTQTDASMNGRYYTFSVVGTGGLDELKFVDIDSGAAGYGVELDHVRPGSPPLVEGSRGGLLRRGRLRLASTDLRAMVIVGDSRGL